MNHATIAQPLRNALASGGAASLLSTLALMRFGRRENDSTTAPVNAVSHWVHGDAALSVDRPTWRHTALGFVIHHVSAVFWGLLFEAALERLSRRSRLGAGYPPAARRALPQLRARPSPALLATTAAAVTAVAALTDLRLVPDRLSPGFERRLRPASVAAVYLTFGAGLLLGAAWLHRRS